MTYEQLQEACTAILRLSPDVRLTMPEYLDAANRPHYQGLAEAHLARRMAQYIDRLQGNE